MTQSQYDPLLFIDVCPCCNSANVEDSGDVCVGTVSCNVCGLSTWNCFGTKHAINIWNKRLHMDQWSFMEGYLPIQEVTIMI